MAFKVLGKFGGGNRKMMIEPQRLEYVSSDFDPPAILAKFDHYQQNVEFPVAQVGSLFCFIGLFCYLDNF